jgi:hypothetical protein
MSRASFCSTLATLGGALVLASSAVALGPVTVTLVRWPYT